MLQQNPEEFRFRFAFNLHGATLWILILLKRTATLSKLGETKTGIRAAKSETIRYCHVYLPLLGLSRDVIAIEFLGWIARILQVNGWG